MTTNLFLGFDVGGEGGRGGSHRTDGCRGHFGWSICCENGDGQLGCLGTGLARSAWDAADQVKDQIKVLHPEDNFRVLAAGIDAPLLWNKKGDKQGYRRAEDILEQTSSNPTAAYRLPGEVTMQGPLIAWYIGAEWSLMITETYPRVFRQLLERINQREMVRDSKPFNKRLDRSTTQLSAKAVLYVVRPELPRPPPLYVQIPRSDLPRRMREQARTGRRAMRDGGMGSNTKTRLAYGELAKPL